MKQKLILFSALLIISLLIGAASAAESDTEVNVTYSETDVLPGDIVNIAVDFNTSVNHTTISIANSTSLLVNNDTMNPLDGEDNSFDYNYTIPMDIISGPLAVDIDAFDENNSLLLNGEPAQDSSAFEFGIGDYLSIEITKNVTGPFIPGKTVNITANFSKPVDHANISIADSGLPKASNANMVGTSPVTDAEMDPISDDGKLFGYDYPIPQDVSGPLDIGVSGFDDLGNLLGDESFPGEIDFDPSFDYQSPQFTLVKPESNFANKSCVKFNFSASDDSSKNIAYALELNGVQKANGVMTSGSYKQLELDLADGQYTWEVKLRDEQGNTGGSGLTTLYVDTKCPSVKLVSPADCYKEVIGPETKFNFICEDALATQYKDDLSLKYTLFIDGKPAGEYDQIPGYIPGYDYEDGSGEIPWNEVFPDGISWEELFPGMPWEEIIFPGIPESGIPESGIPESGIPEDFLDDLFPEDVISGDAGSGESVIKEIELADGAHNWSVEVEDGAGNKAKSEVRKFYVSLDGLAVTLLTPDGGFVTSNPTFKFEVDGKNGEGTGLPFHYKLLINNTQVDANCDGKPDNTVCCEGGACDECDFLVGEDNYSVKASVKDGQQVSWTVLITDCTSGRTYQPDVKYFSVDSKCPAAVANLKVEDAFGLTDWISVRDNPGLMVSWNASTETDLDSDEPYEVYISTSKPNCIEDMKKVIIDGSETHTDGTDTPNQKLESSADKSVWDLCIEAVEGKDLVYGKDYWVVVVSRDEAGNYNPAFAMCGPVQTYEDMSITLEQGWNLKSVSKKLVDSKSCPEDVFGNGSTVLYWDGSCWQFPKTIEPCKGYWVYAKEPLMTNVKFKGMSSEGANPDVPASLTLTRGWHMIGHTSSYFAPWSTALASLNEFNTDDAKNYKFSNLITYQNNEGWGGIIPGIVVENGVAKYIGESDPRAVGALETDNCMVPGQGYWIFMKNEGTYASIENSYKPNVGQDPGEGGFNPFDPSTWPEGFDLNDSSTWPEGFNMTDPSTWGFL
ncbi:hypothetical protein EQO05_06630 [Methanosarcina sp. MSH10X1]|uniref:hypothetical protein n=1 Tax=Methanosarcina sp. MSH10X1 TaxID=2507075 RepID=UPI000FFB10EC|nr:hypothetical protein [Methanosarcina sp. MSH10X1]RXA20244.1 hypothetical protein EQO05_06630 [Methanosarcina sp. MSH10X1]